MRQKNLAGAVLAAVVALLIAPASAQTAQPEDDIVVTGQRLEEAARAFTGAVSRTPDREDQLARFNDKVCPGVVGVGARQGQFIVDAIARRALEVGLEVQGPGCDANILVLVTRDAEGLARTIAEEERYLVANTGVRENISTRGDEALEDFITTPSPVRWWHVSQTETTEGDVLGHTNPYGRTLGPASQEFRGAEVMRVGGNRFGRGARLTQQALRNVVIIVDAERAAQPRLAALSDYIAMVALAQMEPGADTSAFPTILNLFAGGHADINGMTDWDLAYLRGLYSGEGRAPDAGWQNRRIARTMREELDEAPQSQ